MYKIVLSPNEILRTPAKQVDFSGPKLEQIISEMTATMLAQTDPEGVGLAANQVGLPWKIFVARFESGDVSRSKPGKRSSNSKMSTWPVRVFINPEILEHSEELQPTKEDKNSPLEGCLSKPDYYGSVKRWAWVKLRFQTLTEKPNSSGRTDGNIEPSGNVWQNLSTSEEVFKGFAATVIQHEMDHLQGKLFIERILEQKGRLYMITGKDAKGKEKWEEVEI